MDNASKKNILTEGKVLPGIISFTMPIFFGMLFQQFYNMVDTAIVGKYLGINALAGVGSTGSLMFLVIGTVNGICSGFAIPVAQSFGAKNMDMLKRFVAGATLLAAILSAVLTVVTVLLCNNMLVAMDTTAESYEYAYEYLVIIFAGIPFTFLYNLTSGFLRSIGDSKSPLYFLFISSALNIALDFLFIVGFKMSADGAGLATVISQAVSGLACLVYMSRKYEVLKLRRKDFKVNGFILFRLLSVGIPMGIQYGITAVGTIVIQAAVNSFGTITVAGVVTSGKISSLVACPLEALGAAMATFAGQNIGAGNLDRVNRGLWQATFLGFGVSAVMFGVVWFFGRYIALLFMSADEMEAMNYAMQCIRINAAFYCLLTIVLTFRYTIQGMGYSTLAIFAGILEMIARCLIGIFLPAVMGFISICIASPVAWLAADLFLIPAYYMCLKKAKRHYSKAFHTESL
ncbi:MAG: MATE family efflux transporter [Lachnospiraceae bacterium]|nr:MATE family efflux transporter [Lachnospiraceae bacterium]